MPNDTAMAFLAVFRVYFYYSRHMVQDAFAHDVIDRVERDALVFGSGILPLPDGVVAVEYAAHGRQGRKAKQIS